jgi:hypothetical protein
MFQFQRGQEQLNVLSSEHLREKATGGKRERRRKKSEISRGSCGEKKRSHRGGASWRGDRPVA